MKFIKTYEDKICREFDIIVNDEKVAYYVEYMKNPLTQEKLENPVDPPVAVKPKGKVMPGAVGYGLTPRGARKLTTYYEKTYLPADNAMNTMVVKLQCHNYLMGRAATESDGKISLTKTKMWRNFKFSALGSLSNKYCKCKWCLDDRCRWQENARLIHGIRSNACWSSKPSGY